MSSLITDGKLSAILPALPSFPLAMHSSNAFFHSSLMRLRASSSSVPPRVRGASFSRLTTVSQSRSPMATSNCRFHLADEGIGEWIREGMTEPSRGRNFTPIVAATTIAVSSNDAASSLGHKLRLGRPVRSSATISRQLEYRTAGSGEIALSMTSLSAAGKSERLGGPSRIPVRRSR